MIQRLRSRFSRLLSREPDQFITEIPRLAGEIELIARELQPDADDLPPIATDALESLRNTRLLLNHLRLSEGTNSAPAEETSPGTIARELIALRDSLALNEMTVNPQVSELLNGISDQLGRILANDGIVPIDDSGSFDLERHQVIETAPTNDPARDQTIERTVRSGYSIDGRIHRPQEVVLYAYSEQ